VEHVLHWLAIVGVPVCLLFRQRTERMMGHWAVSVLVIFYLGFLGSYALWLRCWAGGPLGVGILLGVVAVVKLTDVGAYFTGVAFGRRPLMPKISPKKTWEGLAGGLLAAGVASVVIFGFAIPAGWPSGGFDHLTLIQVFVFGIVMAIVGQVGDLAESLLKRDTGAKDSGQLVPEFGGILDIIDSPLVAMPVAYALLRWWLAGS
jgi:phosphatidate cytidylyltransferase